MKTPSLLVLIAAGTVTTVFSTDVFGFTEFARGELDLSTTARALYDSRIFGGLSTADDYIFTLDPELIFRREAGELKLDANAGVRINRYVDFTQFNSEDFVGSITLRLPSGGAAPLSGEFETSYDEHTDVNYDVNLRVREKTFISRFDTDIPTSLKTGVLLAGSFRRDRRNITSDRDTWDGSGGFRYGNFLGGATFELLYRRLELKSSGDNAFGIPLDQNSDIYTASYSQPLYHEIKGTISYGYRVLRRSQAEVINGETRSAGSIIALRLDGPFLPESMFPKVQTSLSLGYQKAETPGINDTAGSRFVGDVHVGWQARERTHLSLDARRSQELTVNDLTVETTRAMLGLTQGIGDFTEGNLSAGYEKRDYRTLDHKDDVFIAQAGLKYRITHTWSAEANYSLRSASSTLAAADYTRHLVSVSATYIF